MVHLKKLSYKKKNLLILIEIMNDEMSFMMMRYFFMSFLLSFFLKLCFPHSFFLFFYF
jgi:hypothetical protein